MKRKKEKKEEKDVLYCFIYFHLSLPVSVFVMLRRLKSCIYVLSVSFCADYASMHAWVSLKVSSRYVDRETMVSGTEHL